MVQFQPVREQRRPKDPSIHCQIVLFVKDCRNALQFLC